MDAQAIGTLRQRLERERDQLVIEGDIVIAPNRADPGETKTDEDAQPLNEMHQVIASKRNVERARLLVQINKALLRIRNAPDDFGVCEACDDDIPPRRIELMPWARFCVKCQAKRDPERGVARRSVTDYE